MKSAAKSSWFKIEPFRKGLITLTNWEIVFEPGLSYTFPKVQTKILLGNLF
jgi:hypothetical protein